MKKLTTKQDLLNALTDDKTFSKYQLSFYYEFNKTVDVKLLDDYEVLEAVLKVIPRAYKYISFTKLKGNRDLALIAVRSNNCNRVLKYGSKKFRKDREIAEAIIAHAYLDTLEDVPLIDDEFLHDMDLVIKGCKNNPELYRYLPDDVKDNDEVISVFMISAKRELNSSLYRQLPERYLNSREFIMNHITDDRSAVLYEALSPELQQDYEIAALAAKCGISLSLIKNEKLKDDFDVASICIRNNCSNYLYISDRLKNDERIYNILLEIESIYNWNVYKALPDKFKNRKEILLKFGTEWFDIEQLKKDVSPSLLEDPDVMEKFGLSGEIVRITYYWYHGFYTSETANKIRKAIKNHDYAAFMEIYNTNKRGLPQMAEGFNEKGCNLQVDITQEENFVKITEEDSEAG